MKTKLAVLGCGNMGSAIVLGTSKKIKTFDFHFYDPSLEKAQSLAKQTGGEAHQNMAKLKTCEYFLLACKPQDFKGLAQELKGLLGPKSKIISIIAGVSTRQIQKALECKKLARVMPNTPCLIGEGAVAIYLVSMDEKERETIQTIFSSIAHVHFVSSDETIDIVTAGIASGCGTLFEIARIMIEKLTAMGLKSFVASDLVKQMFKGSSLLMQQSQDSPELLRNKVNSKGGTTEAALKIFKEKNLEAIFGEAIDAAHKRAKELSR